MYFKLKEFKSDLIITRIANIHYFEFTKNYHTKEDKHDFCELLYVDTGYINIISDNYRGVLNAGECIVHLPNENHALSCDSKIAPNVIIIGFESECEEFKYLATSPTKMPDTLKKLLVEVIRESHNVFVPPYDIPSTADMKKYDNFIFGADQLIKNLLEELMIKLIRLYVARDKKETNDKKHTDSTISEICKYLDNNPHLHLSIQKLCILFATNKTTLCTLFKKETGKTIINYYNEVKIGRARILLREGKTVTEVAEELNFSSIHYFSKLFKQLEGMSPIAYMESLKSKFTS